jgi:hypothetical protein
MSDEEEETGQAAGGAGDDYRSVGGVQLLHYDVNMRLWVLR